MMLTWAPGGHHTLGGIFNCCVHIIMYRFGCRLCRGQIFSLSFNRESFSLNRPNQSVRQVSWFRLYCLNFAFCSYYFLAAMGPQYKKYLWWKRYLTRLQVCAEYGLKKHFISSPTIPLGCLYFDRVLSVPLVIFVSPLWPLKPLTFTITTTASSCSLCSYCREASSLSTAWTDAATLGRNGAHRL